MVTDKSKPEERATDAMLRDLDMQYGAVEFGKQKGDPQFMKAAPDCVIRVHTITGAEMAAGNITIPDAVQRYLLAADERNIRVLFVRLFENQGDPLAENLDYVERIAKGFKHGELETGRAKPFAPLGVPLVLRLLMGIGLLGVWLLICDRVTGVFEGRADKTVLTVALLGGLLLLALPAVPGTIGVKIGAFARRLPFSDICHDSRGCSASANRRGRFWGGSV